ncbi:MAG: tetratricopeptide repeat protein [Flavobacteriales bacterium]
MSYSNLGKYHLQNGAVDSAIVYSNKSLVQFKQAKDKMGIGLSYLTIAQAHQQRGQHRDAIQWAGRSMAIAEELHDTRAITEAAKVLSDSYTATGRTEKALTYYRRYISLRDGIQSAENQREVLRQEYSYTYGKQALADSLVYAADLEMKAEEVRRQRWCATGSWPVSPSWPFSQRCSWCSATASVAQKRATRNSC